MRQMSVPIFISAAITLLFCPPSNAQQATSPFDTRGFLDACAGFVPDVDFAIPMDGQCVNQARKMCSLAFGMSENEVCLKDVTAWLQDETHRIWQSLPEDARGKYDEPPTGQQMAEDGFGPDLGQSLPDCEDVEIPDVSAGVVCDYFQAVPTWHAVRIMQRSASAIEPDKE
ncbi:hypothetical protein SAMN05444007_102392 [Cribrihabitans marinus]|uniref:Secreted protein n=1 Tax=Cribrihabitans marinus TaxID=1227549 RepID=A0A1H6TWV8_9RHOB|nr:hypothetical protein [Cribrihabitans marinus]GGH21637.1 hypothetical protein GCM10010973_06340 [Cribrihabitans marinus]SEI80750.1 hypothetical protein SAMN05444007_102392 [Cribrihabitans marinus]